MRPAYLWLVVVLACAALLRFWSIGHGIPYAVGSDEPAVMSVVLRMMRTGDFNPHFFDYPGLFLYLNLAVACVRFLVGAMQGAWSSLAQVEPADFFLWGRIVTATFGVATVIVIHQIGLRWGARHALLAAGLLAVTPMHVRESHFVLTDVPMTFFVTLTLLLTLAAHEKGAAGRFFWAGVAAGLAAGTKYNGALALLMPLVAAWMTLGAQPSRLMCASAAVTGSAVAYLIVAPYTLLDLPGFLNGFAHLSIAYQPREARGEPRWLVYLKHLRNAFWWPAAILAAAGFGLAIVRASKGPGRVRWTLLAAFPLVYFWFISRQTLTFGRYLLPIVPFICLLASIAVISGVSLLRRFDIPRAPRTTLIAALTIAAVLPPAVISIRFVRDISLPSTQAQAYAWILEHVPERTHVAIEDYAIRLPEQRYRVTMVRRAIEQTFEEYAAERAGYVVISSWVSGHVFDQPQRFPRVYAQYRALLDRMQEVKRFAPADGMSGPELRIYRVPPAP